MKLHLYYSINSLKVKIRLKNSVKITTLLDTDIKINFITGKVIENAGLAILHSLKLELMSYTSYSYSFFGLYENIEIVIKELKIRHPIFVFKQEDHNQVLDQLFLNSVKFS